MVAKPVDAEAVRSLGTLATRAGLTKPLLRRAALLDDLDQARSERLDGGDVVSEDTHVTGGGGKVDLNNGGCGVDGLFVVSAFGPLHRLPSHPVWLLSPPSPRMKVRDKAY